MSAPAAVLSGLVLPQNRTGEDRWYTWSMDHPAWLIPPPLDGSFGCFTFTLPGEYRKAFCAQSESQEDREGPQLTSSDLAVAGLSCDRLYAFESGAGCAVAMMTRMRSAIGVARLRTSPRQVPTRAI